MDESTVPRPRALRLDSLGLSSTDAFVFARIDGATTLDEVADSTGLAVDVVIAIARRLEELGAIERPGARARAAASSRYSDAFALEKPAGTSARTRPLDREVLGQIPRRTGAVVESLKLETGDAFLLSIVDGHFSVGDLAELLGEAPEQVVRRMEGLVRAGALVLGAPSSATSRRSVAPATDPAGVSEVPPKPPPPPPHYGRKRLQSEGSSRNPSPSANAANPGPGPRTIRPSHAHDHAEKRASGGRLTARPMSAPRSSTPPRSTPTRPPQSERAVRRASQGSVPRHPVLSDARQLARATPPPLPPPPPTSSEDPACDLDLETLAKIDAAAELAGRTHYAVLGVPRHAGAKEIRRAYFAIAAALHPDRYFGKRLGAHKKKLEHAFRLASDAYEMLRLPAKRADYDDYLRLTRQSMQMEAALAAPLAEPPPPAAPPERVDAAPAPAPPSAPIAHRFEPVAFAAPAPASVRTRVAPVAPLTTDATAGNAVARAPQPAASAAIDPPSTGRIALRPPPSEGVAVAPRVIEPPRASQRAPASAPNDADATPRTADGRRSLAASKSASLLDGAQKALMQGDAAAAANLYRLALHYAEDAATRGYAQSGLQEARSTLADTHLQKARYEEKESRWTDAVASYAKALDGRPDDPSICERLANALRQEGHDLVRGTRLAELAVSRAPRRAAYRKTLGLIYADAGLRDKALEELEKACEIDPSDEQAAHALAALRKRRR